MPFTSPTRYEGPSGRRKAIYLLAVGVTLLLAIIVSQTSFDLPFLNPDTNQKISFFAGLSALIFLLFVALTYILARNLLKLVAERRLGVLGSKFRTRLVAGGLLLSFLPVIFMYWANAYPAVTNKLAGFWPSPSNQLLWNAEKWAFVQ